MRYLHESVSAAARAALAEVAALGGLGGLIAVDRRGRIAMPFTTEGMYRGHVLGNGKVVVSIFR
jgi:beta-aspartyl-peptidase (threonine type)